ncbi:MAG: hypothetical protein ACKOQ6_03700 [Bacteroidota bacterium]
MSRSLWPLLFFTVSFLDAYSQQYLGDTFTEDFIFSVQTIDDFFDRFNNSPNSPAISYIKQKYPKSGNSRSTAILSLFNRADTTWEKAEIRGFIERFASDTSNHLNFEQSNWFAVLHSKVIYKSKRLNLDLVMIVEPVFNPQTKSLGYKWSLYSANARFFPKSDSAKAVVDTGKSKPMIGADGQFLHPMSHAINFMNIFDVFKKGVIRKYFARKARSPELNSLARMVDQGAISFLQVDSISYCLAQLPGWIVEVDYYDRESGNSGWLISGLIKADADFKRRYLSRYLNIR